ncbi:MAG: endo-1,4-beta-xylanase [Litorimonas sp.]
MPTNRRELLVCGGSAMIVAACSNVPVISDLEQGASAIIPAANQTPTLPKTSLSSLAKAKGLRFGTAIGSGPLEDAAYRRIIAAECDTLVAENEHKLYTILGQAGPYQFSRGDELVEWGLSNDMDFRGHVLLWNRMEFTPDWVSEKDFGGKKGMEDFVSSYIQKLTQHYGEKIYSWDVVNETIDPATGKMRDTVFVQNGGEEIVDFSFHKAKEFAPHAELVYNDYMIWESGNEKHRYGVLKLLEGFRKRGVPIDTFGIQGHLGTKVGDPKDGYPDPQAKEWQRFLDEIVDMDYKLIVSEFDVNDTGLNADPEIRDKEVAAYGKAFLDMMLSYTQTKDVLAWGLCDRHTWLQTWWPRKDNLVKRPSLYDVHYQPKPLREAIAQAFKDAPVRSA